MRFPEDPRCGFWLILDRETGRARGPEGAPYLHPSRQRAHRCAELLQRHEWKRSGKTLELDVVRFVADETERHPHRGL